MPHACELAAGALREPVGLDGLYSLLETSQRVSDHIVSMTCPDQGARPVKVDALQDERLS